MAIRFAMKLPDLEKPEFSSKFNFISTSSEIELIFRYFEKHGLDLNQRNFHWDTPYHLAAEKGHLSTVKALFDVSERKSPRNKESNTPLHLAVMSEAKSRFVEQCEVTIFLMENLPVEELNYQNDEDLNPMYYAAVNNQVLFKKMQTIFKDRKRMAYY